MAERLFAVFGIATLLWLVLTDWVLPRGLFDLLTLLQVDKIIHFSGGAFVAGLLIVGSNIRGRMRITLLVAAVGILWEIWEIYFLPEQMVRFRREFFLWLSDSVLDFFSDMLGAYFFSKLFDMPQIDGKRIR